MLTTDSPHSMLATLTQDRQDNLTDRVRDLPTSQFVELLEQITQEFEHFLRAIDLIHTDSLETMLEQILEAFTLKIGQVLCADRTTIFLVDREKEQLWSKLAQGENGQVLELRLPINAGIAGYVAQTGECLNIPNAYCHVLFNKDVDRETGYLTRNILCMPIFSTKGDRVVAVVQLLNKAGHQPFNAADEQRFREFADSIGIILESCNSFYLAARNQRGVTALLKATSSLGQSLNLEKTLQVVMDEARDLMQADRSTLFLLDRETGELWSKVATADGQTTMKIRIPANRGIAGYVASTGQTLNIPDAYEDPRFDANIDKQTGYRTRNILCMPVYNSEGALIGATQLINKHQGHFTSSDEEFMRAFNIQAGIALENARLFESVLQEKQYQKDILQSLSDAVISTNMQGKIVTINDAALQLLCPAHSSGERQALAEWREILIDRPVWEVVSIEHLQMRLEDSLKHGAKQYVPEQSLVIGGQGSERSINLTVTPLTNPEGDVRGGLVVLEDISQEKRMKTTLYRYMTPGVAEQVMALGDDALMVGERKDVSILFSDIRRYTSLTEKMTAAEVVALLNNYFETMVEAVFSFDGTLDKFIGDALMAVFGAPLPLENHAWMAVQSALDMRQRLQEFNQKRQAIGQPLIHIGMGISSGEVVSGNIGSQRRMDYTVIGDGVDISSRLEGATKEYGCDIILSEFTYNLCAEKIQVRELDRVRVKGKTRPVYLYELIGDRQHPLNVKTEEFLALYAAGRSAYTSRHFQQAMRLFEMAHRLKADDRATALFMKRSNHYLQTPPSETWDGVYTMLTK